MARRLPVYLLLDTSGSMRGEPIEALRNGLAILLATLRQDPYALSSVWLSLITFDREARVLVPLTALDQFQLPPVEAPESGPTHTGSALQLLGQQLAVELLTASPQQRADWSPLLFLMTDGRPSDRQLYVEQVAALKQRPFGNIVACAAGPKAPVADLQLLTPEVHQLDTLDAHTFAQFFRWVSTAVGSGSRSQGLPQAATLPPPPPEIHSIV
jgi:uncharacterized protein YegL